jgi:hypothetical protein
MAKPGSRAEAAMWELCATYGYCIGGQEADDIIADPPDAPEAFLDAVLRAEGYEYPELLDRQDRGQLVEVVRAWLFDEGEGRGTKSGLPRLPRD